MGDITGFVMKDCLSLHGLGGFFFSLSNQNDEPIYTYNDEFMTGSVCQSIEAGKVCAYYQ